MVLESACLDFHSVLLDQHLSKVCSDYSEDNYRARKKPSVVVVGYCLVAVEAK